LPQCPKQCLSGVCSSIAAMNSPTVSSRAGNRMTRLAKSSRPLIQFRNGGGQLVELGLLQLADRYRLPRKGDVPRLHLIDDLTWS
jgi:hypothetical protein